ncbi:MAG: hypothetical protein RL521_442, partial [Bacteroidota bacterium]
ENFPPTMVPFTMVGAVLAELQKPMPIKNIASKIRVIIKQK